ncbi:MAG: hypothetical protein KAT15_20365, partial [Bacteroidales bacterium]|nr:hypothetical protein [Bacteroidales bacterium]
MRIPKAIFIILICFLIAISARAQLISVLSQVNGDSMMIGDQVVFNIHVDAAENVRFRLPEIGDTLTRDLEVLFPISADTILSDGRRVVDHSYMITGFEQGVRIIPVQPVVYEVNNMVDTALSMPILIRIFEPEVDTAQQIKPIKPPINTPLTL